jgi:hypothetical protein
MTSLLGLPSNPTTSQQYTVGSKVFIWNGSVWNLLSSGVSGGGGGESDIALIIGLS